MKKTKRNGFTLIELALVIFIIGFLLSVVFSSLKNLIAPDVYSESELLTAVLKNYYKQAQLQNINILLELNLDKNTYSAKKKYFDEENGFQYKEILQKDLPATIQIISIINVDGILQDSGIVKIPFTYNAISADYIIHIGKDDNIENSIIIYRYGGKVEIKKGRVDTFSNHEKIFKQD